MLKTNKKYWLSIIILSIIGSLLFISFLGEMLFNFKALEFKLSVQIFDHGYTDIKIPPVGSIQAKTHISPIKIKISLENIDINLLQNLLEKSPDKEKLLDNFKGKLNKILKVFLIRLFFLSVLGGIAGSLIYERKKIKPLLCGAFVGVLVYFILFVSTFITFDINAFQNPEYQGVLEAAPWMIGLAEQALVKLDTLGKQLELMAKNFYILFQKINSLEDLSSTEDSIKVLHVSDFHNNRAALQFISQVVKSFKVDFIIDTGDFTDYATPIEAQLLNYLKNIPVPYIFVPGNHDSPLIIKKLQEFPQVIVLKEGVLNLKGLKIMGLRDPASDNNRVITDNKVIKKFQKKLIDLWNKNSANSPDIVLVHNYQIGQVLKNKASLILHGHDHECRIYKDGKTLILDAGTSGAAGIRGLQVTKEIPYTVLLLHFQKNKNNNMILIAVDTIKVFNLESGFILERRIFTKNS